MREERREEERREVALQVSVSVCVWCVGCVVRLECVFLAFVIVCFPFSLTHAVHFIPSSFN